MIRALQRDWSRKETASEFSDILFAVEGYYGEGTTL
jgi:hypothetical protein